MYEIIYGQCEKKDLDFKTVVEEFFGHKKMNELIRMLKDSEINSTQGKEIVKIILDGDARTPD